MRMILMLRSVLSAVACGTLLTGCGSAGDEGPGGTATVAAFYPLAWAAEQVGGRSVDVDLLTTPGVEPHDLELTPQQVAAVADAAVLVVESGFQPAVDDVVTQEAEGTVVDAADVVDLMPAEDGEESDPHFWHDPLRMARLTDSLAEAYAATDPDHAEVYREAADRARARLERLDAAYREGLQGCRTQTVITSHDAFGYLAERYRLTLLPIAGLDPGTEPSPERIAELADLADEREVTTVFTETLVDPSVAEAVADEAGLELAELDPIEGLSDDTAGADYLTLMRRNLDALVEANGC